MENYSHSARYVLLSLASAALLSVGYLVPHCGSFSLVGFVPLLLMNYEANRNGARHFFLWYYFTFVLWNALTTFWVCNATVGGGIAAILINALFMSIVWSAFRLSGRVFSGALPYFFLAATWIAWERFYFSAEISWPWLTLGNAFATTTRCVQWYEVTGLLGGSLWIWLCNLSVFALITTLKTGRWKDWNKKAKVAAISGTLVVFIAPVTASLIRYALYEEKTEGSINVCLLQPNINPYQKFESFSQARQNDIITGLIDKAAENCPTPVPPYLYIAPETITNDVILNRISDSPSIREYRSHIAGMPGVNLLFGASTYEFFRMQDAPSFTARKAEEGVWYEDHNSALIIDDSPRIGVYHKSRLVIGVEKMPWPRLFSKIDSILGGNAIGHCIGQDEVGLLNVVYCDTTAAIQSVPIGCAVCYESVYPEYFASYVSAGAKAMTVITNDSWWGDTPGYRQHLSYSRLRAIETRRNIARSANTGISAFINRKGDIAAETEWNAECTLEGEITCSSTLTPFVKYGDIIGRICTMVFILMLAAMAVNSIVNPKRR